ncbi:MAG TPA: 2OG-Fe(II) oxygenase [Coxiellaceae bacterium]|nr:2OG-Fe(II) oxygenase [Coxiellaceae bacterium]
MNFSAINLEALNQAPLVETPFPYVLIPNLVNPHLMSGILAAFPEIEQGGSFPITSKTAQGDLATLVSELESAEFRTAISKKLGMDLGDRAPMITLRGYSRAKDGQIHTDSKSKLVTLLIYLNPDWDVKTGRLRLLYDGEHLEPYAAEIPPTFGSSVIFRVTDNCWHGYEAFTGTRRSLQLNYMASAEQARRHVLLHRLSAWVKKHSRGQTPKDL